MDDRYYYRLLGVSPNAAPEEIRSAYERRINALSRADYGDDPEYVKKKKQEITTAYRVITGSAPALTKERKRISFEKLKDAMEIGEGGEDSWKDEADASEREKFSPLKAKTKNFLGSTGRGLSGKTGRGLSSNAGGGLSRNAVRGIIVASVIVVCVLVVTLCLFSDIRETVDDGHYSSYVGTEDYDDESIERAEAFCASLDFKEMLDTEVMDENRDYVDLTYGDDEYMSSDIYDSAYDLFYELNIFSPYEFYTAITGDDEYYYSHDDYSCALTLTQWMGAPDFEDIAGSENLYTEEPILNMADYLEYLREVVEDNGEDY